MTPFRTLEAIAAPYAVANIDTDKIIPARFLKTVSKTGLGRALFHDLRFDATGRLNPEFILNKAPWNTAGIFVAGRNFGCGSSREHAPWALADFGIRCVIAESFADIFFNNCFKNGILPISLPPELVDAAASISAVPDTAVFAVDLPDRTLAIPGLPMIRFEVDPERSAALIEGRDDIALSLRHVGNITNFESDLMTQRTWLPSVESSFGRS